MLYRLSYASIKITYASSRARTGDLSVNSRPLCQLSHGSCNFLIYAYCKQKMLFVGMRSHWTSDNNAYLIKRLDHRVTIVTHSWPSGLRRCVQVAVSSDAWVRIPQDALIQKSSLSVLPPTVGIEPTTIGLKGQRSTFWAKWAKYIRM